MKETAVDITIQSLQRMDGHRETASQRAQGLLRREGDAWVLAYREGQDSGLGNTRTVLRLEGDTLTLTRTGEITARMVFQPGHSHPCSYETPYGSLPMTVRTLECRADLSREGGRVSLHYHMELGGGADQEARLRLTVKAKENEI